MQKQRGVVEIVLVLLLVAALGVAGYFYLQSRNTQEKPGAKWFVDDEETLKDRIASTPSPDPTADWGLYTDSNKFYTLKYPQGWDTLLMSGGKTLMVAPKDRVEDVRKISGGFGGGPFLVMTVTTFPASQDMVLPKTDEFQEVKEKKVTIGGKPATEYEIKVLQGSPIGDPGDKLRNVKVQTKDGIISIDLLDSQYDKTYDQILSTFRFD